MFLEFYGLREQPFGVTPDPRFLYLTQSHREALASLFYGIESGRGFLSLIANPGMGKTTLLFQLLQHRKGDVHSAFLFQTQCDSKQLLRYMMHDLGLNSESDDAVRMHSELNQFLFREAMAGRRVVVFIDEAQNLSDSSLETVRLLSNFEATNSKFLQIVLAGQPELAKRLKGPEMAQLQQRIAMQARLDPLEAPEVISYVKHRLQVAGYQGPELFTPGAFAILAEHSRGIPRLINHLCFSSLSTACALGRKQVTAEMVREAAVDLSLEIQAPQPLASQQQKASSFVPALRSPLQPAELQFGDYLFARRFIQTLVLTLAIGSLTIYFGVLHRSKPMPSPAAATVDVASGSATATPQTPAASSTPYQPRDPPPPRLLKISSDEKEPNYFTYVVQPKDTLRNLCVSDVGRYDKALLDEIRRLNPTLKNPNHLEPGQKIRLPLDPPD